MSSWPRNISYMRPFGFTSMFFDARLFDLLFIRKKQGLLESQLALTSEIWVDKRAAPALNLHCLSLFLSLLICQCVSLSLPVSVVVNSTTSFSFFSSLSLCVCVCIFLLIRLSLCVSYICLSACMALCVPPRATVSISLAYPV
jgi:hypothetical protein